MRLGNLEPVRIANVRLGRLGRLGQSTAYDPASYGGQFGSTLPWDFTSAPSTGGSTATSTSTSSGSTSSSLSTQSMDALFGTGGNIFTPQGTDPLASLGSPQYVTQSAGTPAPSSDLSLIGKTITQAGQLFQYVQGIDSQGNAAAVAVPASATAASAKAPSPMLLLAIGAGILLFMRK